MTTPSSRGGSSVSARDRTPSVQLNALAELLSKSLGPDSSATGALAMPFAFVNGNRLILNTRGVLERLLRSPAFSTDFEPGEDSGFVRDMVLPPIGTTAKLGGRLLAGTEAKTSLAIEKLHEAVRAELDRAFAGLDPRRLTVDTWQAALEMLADSIDEHVPALPGTASMVPVHFAAEDRNAGERSQDLGRVLTAVETIDGRDWLEVLLNSIATKLRRDGLEEDEIDAVVAHVRGQRQRPDSQIRRFLEFLDDEALARVRLQVSMRLMNALAEQGSECLKAYVSRVRECYERFGGPRGESLLLDVAKVYGQASTADMAEELRKAMFYGCLPVWAEWSTQLFETRTEPTRGFATQREVSYRFRVNGLNPMTGQSAFVSRLDRLAERLLAQPGAEARVGRFVVQTLFLFFVVPDSADAPLGPLDVAALAARMAEELRRDPVGTLTSMLEALRHRAPVMTALANELIHLLQTKSRRLVSAAARAVDRFTVSVHRNIVNWEAVTSISSPATDILVKSERGPDAAVWFSHLTISDAATVSGSVASYSVHTELRERSLAPSGPAREVRMARDLTLPVLPIRFVPHIFRKADSRWEPAMPQADVLDAGVGVDVQYDVRSLTLMRAKDTEKARSEQLRTAACTAFALLTYLALWDVLRRARQTRHGGELAATLVRLQPLGKEVEDTDGSAAVYAISQSIEKALSRDVPVKLQGLVTGSERPDTLRWRKRGALHAMLGGQPLIFEMDGALDRVALVTYVTRPCDTHPAYGDADGFLFVSRSYQAVRNGADATLRLDRMNSRYVEHRKEFLTPQLVLEEVARLRNAGFRHVLLLSHHFGNRHIGRATERHSPHGTLQFLDEAVGRFPDMHLYTLRRDVFPATRLRKRASTESGFEVTQFTDHQAMYQDVAPDVLRSLLPVYTFATLAVVDDTGRPQSGFCTYFFDVEQRITDLQMAETVRQNILGTGAGADVRASLVSVLRAIHFMESEKPASKDQLLPVLDPFDWATPVTSGAAGELGIMSRRGKGNVLLSFPALLSHVTKVLHKEAE